MASRKSLEILRQGRDVWNHYRQENKNEMPSFKNADLRNAQLEGYDLWWVKLLGANLEGANLRKSKLKQADLRRAVLTHANLEGANLSFARFKEADLKGAQLQNANLCAADLSNADLDGANLIGANLTRANLVETNFHNAILDGCKVYGLSAWNLRGVPKSQKNLIITPEEETIIAVDDLEVAQFIYLLLNREKLGNVIDATTKKGVLILGRFGDGGLDLLRAIADWLRQVGYLPMLFDIDRPTGKTYTETVRTIIGLARFVIVDLSGPSVPQEITATVDLYNIPFVPIIERKRKEWSMFKDFLIKDNVLKQEPEFTPLRFENQSHLLELLADEIIAPAERFVEKRQKLIDKVFGRT